MSPQHTLSTVREEDRTVIALSGEIDTANADEVAQAIAAEFTDGRAVLIDLSELSFIDSSGLRMLVGLVRDAHESGWSLTIGRDLAPMVRRVFEISGIFEQLPIEGT